ncbi:MAG: YceI family protein [Bacteroidales bacterium]|nr:YceI family protein [Bacteroidales bacterium]
MLAAFVLLMAVPTFAQRYITKNGYISFYAATKLETIEAKSNQVDCALDTQSGFFVVKALMRSFIFERALMQEHFNEEYVQSDKYPDATFVGKVENLKDIGFSKPGTYPAVITGKLTIHGITNTITAHGTFTVADGKIAGSAKFPITIGDYGISIPAPVVGKIAKSFLITVKVDLNPLK